MIRANPHYAKLQASYLFSEIGLRVKRYDEEHPDSGVIKLGIGDVTRPLVKCAADAIAEAAKEMMTKEGFRGYGPEQGYSFLREAVVERDFAPRGLDIDADEIFVSDGSKCDTANFQELFPADIRIAVPDPVYPVYIDTNVMAGRTGTFHDGRYGGVTYMEGNRDNGFVPPPPGEAVDLLYLCFPNNPTGAVATHEQLAAYVEYAHNNHALILFDAAYAEFIQDGALPRSIFEIDGARSCAVEFRSFSKTAGFTGLRTAYTAIPKEITLPDGKGGEVALHALWNRRQSTKFNGTSYPIQRAAAAVYSASGSREIEALISYYMRNATRIRGEMEALGYECFGGINSPYVWIYAGQPSWDFFDSLLDKAGVVTTPGMGFGPAGEGYIRISAFNDHDKVDEALKRIKKVL